MDGSEPPKDFRSWLALAMKARRLGVRQLAQYTGVSRSTISQILRGETDKPTMETIQKLAEFFHTDVRYLVELTLPASARTGAAPEVDLDDPELTLLLSTAGRELSPEARESLKRYLRFLLAEERKSEPHD